MGKRRIEVRWSWRTKGLAALWALIVSAALSQDSGWAFPSHFPEDQWERKGCAELGLDEKVFDGIRDYLGGRGCIVRHGYLAYEWGDCSQPGDVASAAKPWYTTFLLLAVREGLLNSVDVPVTARVPELRDLGGSDKDAKMTFAHMANQISCYGVRESPGTAFDYNDYQMALFIDILFGRVYGVPWKGEKGVDEEVLLPRLADILQCEDHPSFLAFGGGDRAGRLSVSPRDFARFGWLMLNRGRWNGRQVLPDSDVLMATRSPLPNRIPRTSGEEAPMLPEQRSLGSRKIPDNQTDHFGSYSWAWWLNGVDRDGARFWPDAPLDTYAALGHENGQRGMAVIPSLDLVLSWNDTTLGDRPSRPHPLNEVFRLILQASEDSPMPGQLILDPEHPAWIARNSDQDGDGRLDPFFMAGPGDPEGFLYLGERRVDGSRDGGQEAILHRIQQSGANCLYVQIVRSHGGDGEPTENPFVDSQPDKGLDEDILQQWERWFIEMDEAGITVYLFFYDDSASIWDTGDIVEEAEQAFLSNLVNRFEHHRHLVWCIAEEYQERFSPARVNAIAKVIWEADEHQHVIAVHKLNGTDFSEFAEDPCIRQFAMQINLPEADALHAGVVSAWRESRGRYGLNLAEAEDHGFGAEARRKNWGVALAGASVMALGWDFRSTDRPSDEDLANCGHLVRFMESSDFRDMEPRDDLAGQGTTYLMAQPGQGYIAYLANAEEGLGVRNVPGGEYELLWYDPSTGAFIEKRRVSVATGDLHVSTPGQMRGDVVVYLRRVSREGE